MKKGFAFRQEKKWGVLLFCSVALLWSWKKSVSFQSLPSDFPAMVIPSGNEITKDRIALGKRLFFDKNLSVNSQIACVSCHNPSLAFADSVAISPGVAGRLGNRNAPTLANVGYNPTYLFDGFLKTLETQALVPIQEHAEMDFNIVEIGKRLNQDRSYVQQAMKCYGRKVDPYVITRALSTYQRTLVSYQSKYDLYKKGKRKLTPSEKNGMDLFFNKLHCSKCHGGFNFTNFAAENNGLYEHYLDSGRMRVTQLESDRDRFKIPTLRNIQLTAPYMHDGSIKTLEEVFSHYQTGGKKHKNKSDLLLPFALSSAERKDLLQFLYTLTDWKFIHKNRIKKDS